MTRQPPPYPQPARTALIAAWLLAWALALPGPAPGMTLTQEPMPDTARHEIQQVPVSRSTLEFSVTREKGGADITPPTAPSPALRLDKPKKSRIPEDMQALNKAWDLLGKEQGQEALKLFAQAASSPDKLVAQEAMLGEGYTNWRLGHEDQAEAIFRTLVDQQFRIQEVLPNLLFLLRKHGGPAAVEPYLHYLPEADRDVWRK